MYYCPDVDCGLPADLLDEFTLTSTDGPIRHRRTMCVMKHHYTVIVE